MDVFRKRDSVPSLSLKDAYFSLLKNSRPASFRCLRWDGVCEGKCDITFICQRYPEEAQNIFIRFRGSILYHIHLGIGQ